MPSAKKSQMSLIILAAIFIVIIAAFIFYIAYYFKQSPIEPLAFEKLSIENYINNCVKKTGEEGLKLLGIQGGSIILADYLQTPNFGISYLYHNGNKVPSIEKMQNELSSYMNNNLNVCLKDLNDFKAQGWNVEKGVVSTAASINELDVLFEVNYPMKIASKGNTLNFEVFASKINVRLKYIYNLVTSIVDLNSKIPRSVDRTALSNYDVDITVFPYEHSMIYVIDDSKSSILKQPYRFMFAMKFE